MENGTEEGSKLIPEDPKMEALVSAMAHVQAKAASEETASRTPATRVRPLFIVALLLGLGVVIAVNLLSTPLPPPTSIEASLQETIYVTALALNAEFEETGAYPADLESIGMDEEGLSYDRRPEGYSLVAEEEETRIRYNSEDDLGPFKAAFLASLPPFEGDQ